MFYITLDTGFYCESGKSFKTTSLRFATSFNSFTEAWNKAKKLQEFNQTKTFAIINSQTQLIKD
jgi:hypothetical protein